MYLIKINHFKTKLVIKYWVIFFVVMVLSFSTIYILTKKSLKESVDDILLLQVELIKDSIETSTDAAIKNFYRATAYAAYDNISVCYEKYINGEIMESEAKKLAWDLLSGQRLGPSGYATIMDSNAIMLYHPFPELIGSDLSDFEFTKDVFENEDSIISYGWKNPDETDARQKYMYSLYFEEWDWYISITGYKSELMSLVNISDFEDKILSIRFGETGYPLILDMEGTFLVHPEYKGVNMFNRQDAMGEITRTAIKEKNGKSEYLWKNPGEDHYRKKFTLYSEIEQFGMIVAVTAYESEFLKPLRDITRVFIISLLISLILIGYLTQIISKSITKPIEEIKNKMDMAALGDLSIRSSISSSDEIGVIGVHFNNFVENLQRNQLELKDQIDENCAIADKLRKSLYTLKETQQRLLEEERYSNMGRLLARISHHMNTPLGTAVTAVTFLKKEVEDFSLPANDKKIIEFYKYKKTVLESTELLEYSINRLIKIVSSFKLLQVNIDKKDIIYVNLHDFFIYSCINKWKSKLPKNIEIKMDCAEDLIISSYIEPLQNVIDNLISNSINHGFTDGRSGFINLQVKRTENGAKIIYSDTGSGISNGAVDRIFEPFFSINKNNFSQGLGLNIIYNIIVESLNGSISYEGNENSGVKFVIDLPNI